MRVSRLHFIAGDTGRHSALELVAAACAAGLPWIQLRIKDRDFTEWLSVAAECRTICDEHGTKMIVNDNVLVAREVGADGVHLGQADMDPQKARHILGEDFLIGGTANTTDDIDRLLAARVDYIGLGPFRQTSTKKSLAPILGGKGVEGILGHLSIRKSDVPVVVIGGVRATDVAGILRLGAHGVAVSSGIVNAQSFEAAAQTFLMECSESELGGDFSAGIEE